MARPSLADSLKAIERKKKGPAKAPPRPFHAATREGLRKVTVPLDPAQRRALKLLAAETDVSIEALLREAVADLLAKRQDVAELLARP